MEDDAGTGRWLTYDELAVVRGIKRSGAVRLVQRLKWRRQAGNDGKARILVPHDELRVVSGTRPHTDRPRRGGDDGGGTSFDGTMSVHTRALAVLEEAVTGLTRRAEQAEARADDASAAAVAANQRADAALAVADRAQVQLSDAASRIGEAERRAEAERARADQAETDRRAAEGRVERLEQDRREALALVEQSAALLAVERGKADGLRDRLVGAQAEQALAQRAATETRERLQRVQDAAEALRQADEARKARGRWARLRAAWWGTSREG
jgi:hypothetical protein